MPEIPLTQRLEIFYRHLKDPQEIVNVLRDWKNWPNYLKKGRARLSDSYALKLLQRELMQLHEMSLKVESVKLIDFGDKPIGYNKTMPITTELFPVCSMGYGNSVHNPDYAELSWQLNEQASLYGPINGTVIAGPTSIRSTGELNNGMGYRTRAGEWRQTVTQDNKKGSIAVFDTTGYGPHLVRIQTADETKVLLQEQPEAMRAVIGTSMCYEHDGGNYSDEDLFMFAMQAGYDNGEFFRSDNFKYGFLAEHTDEGESAFSYHYVSSAQELINDAGDLFPQNNWTGVSAGRDLPVIALYLMLKGLNGSGVNTRLAMLEMNSTCEPQPTIVVPDIKYDMLTPFGFYVPKVKYN